MNKLFVITPKVDLAYQYCTNYLKVPSTKIEVISEVEQLQDIDDYRVCVAVPYIVDGMGLLIEAASKNPCIELLTQDQVVMVGQGLSRIIKDTFDALPLQSYPASYLIDFIQQRMHSWLGTNFSFDFAFNMRNGNIEMVPHNQPTASYLIMATRYLAGV